MKERYVLTEDLIADKGIRFVNFLIDMVVRLGLGYVIVIVIAVIAQAVAADGVISWMANAGLWEEFVFGILVALFYFNVMEIAFAQTVAKLITGTVVVDYHGEKPDTRIILTRTLCRIIPFEPFSFLGDGRGWHDSIPDVYVVRKKALSEAKERHADFEALGEN